MVPIIFLYHFIITLCINLNSNSFKEFQTKIKDERISNHLLNRVTGLIKINGDGKITNFLTGEEDFFPTA